MSATPRRLSVEESTFLTRVMTLGTAATLPVVMTPGELARLIGVVYADTDSSARLDAARPGMWGRINPGGDYYALPDTWFVQPLALAAQEHVELLRLGIEHIPDFVTYLRVPRGIA